MSDIFSRFSSSPSKSFSSIADATSDMSPTAGRGLNGQIPGAHKIKSIEALPKTPFTS
jgi:hypothetical protein